MASVVSERVVFVTGKGGVGKSTMAAALARSAAERDGDAVLVEIEGATGAARALGRDGRGVRLVTLRYMDALTTTISHLLSSRILARLVVGQRAMRRVLDAVPAIRELVVLDGIRALAHEHPRSRVVVDLPATGHAIDWLRVPAAAERFLGVGPAARMCRAIQSELLAPSASAIVVVTTLEPVVASETEELCARINDELGRAPALLVMNRVPHEPSSEALAAAGEAAERDPRFIPVHTALTDDRELAQALSAARAALTRLSGARARLIPEWFRDPSSAELAPLLEPGP